MAVCQQDIDNYAYMYEAKVTGTRLYSMKEIRRMAQDGFSDDFLRYLGNAPKSVQDIVNSWMGEEHEKLDVVLQPYMNVAQPTDSKQEEMAAASGSCGVTEDIEETVDEVQEEVVTQDIVADLAENPYSKLHFKDRIHVEGVYAFAVEASVCPVHNVALERIQVVTQKSRGGTYSLYMHCCKKCKQLYVLPDEKENMIEIFRQKEVHYQVKETQE